MNKEKSIKSILDEFKRKVMEIADNNLKEILLFGSHARGKAGKHSDIDIILIFQKEPSANLKRKIRKISNSLSLEHDIVIAEFMLTQSEYKRYNTPFLLNVKKEGVAQGIHKSDCSLFERKRDRPLRRSKWPRT